MKTPIIYLIDDDEIVNFVNREIIIFANITDKVLAFQEPKMALNSLKDLEYSPDIILLDINMHGMDGFQFLKEYNHLYPDAVDKIAILTSSKDEREKEKAKEMGISHFITKPLTDKILFELIDTLELN